MIANLKTCTKSIYLLGFILFLSLSSIAQSVVVSTYLNHSDPRLEWTELLVVSDDVDMRGWTIRDNNATQTAWQTPVTFQNVPFWNHMRRGTIIMLWHRTTDLAAVNHPLDVDKSDGYIELDVKNTTYFSGGDFEAGLNTTLNIASGGDIVQLRNSLGTHVHGIGHLTTPGTSWTVMASPKLNHTQGTSNGDAIYVCPGNNYNDYGINAPQSGSTYTSRNNSTITFGVPNTCVLWPNTNRVYWRQLREPDISSQTVSPSSVVPGLPGSITFSWAAATDAYSTDATIGYIILRNTTNSFVSPPIDGLTYSIGNTIGGATVVGQLNSSTTTTFTDNTVMNGNNYYYRVYAFRYGADNLTGTAFPASDNARARAYNETNYVSIDWPFTSPLPVELLFFNAQPTDKVVRTSWATSSEINNDYFTVERSSDGENFSAIGYVSGHGNSNITQQYEFIDEHPEKGISYYRLRQTDFDGTNELSRIVAVEFSSEEKFSFNAYPNPFSGQLFLSTTSSHSGRMNVIITDNSGKKVKEEKHFLNSGFSVYEIQLDDIESGSYILSLETEGNFYHSKLVKQ